MSANHISQLPIGEDRQQILQTLRCEVADMFEVDPNKLTTDSHLFKDLGLDSLDAIDLAIRLEEFTGQRVDEQSLRKLATLGDVVDLVITLRRAAKA